MRRRDLIAASAALPVLSAGSDALAGERPAAGGASISMPGVGLPIIAGGRLRNYVFVSLRLHLGGSATPESMRPKEAFLRDALVRAGHRTPFTVPDDWRVIDTAALSASLMRSAATIAGRGSVTRVEIVSQAPRRRTGVTAG
ncbi:MULTISPECIES: hypothetical protein [unclassified Brevundimonas]|uniref:hypothetical protein n=1 Tax=unclassified Brevundimonas TaxID=2622653 RepID=UPI0006F3BBA4|nr:MULTISPECIES: hypothetical protein [unclassified Brevundimonas]KQY95590.1 hypothetical protein ASD25_16395 [Brevundimonas sp. Root1423]KRA29091.1 hypothetical protein ASD59_04665 [Brevundimonas sp. Root608]